MVAEAIRNRPTYMCSERRNNSADERHAIEAKIASEAKIVHYRQQIRAHDEFYAIFRFAMEFYLGEKAAAKDPMFKALKSSILAERGTLSGKQKTERGQIWPYENFLAKPPGTSKRPKKKKDLA